MSKLTQTLSIFTSTLVLSTSLLGYSCNNSVIDDIYINSNSEKLTTEKSVNNEYYNVKANIETSNIEVSNVEVSNIETVPSLPDAKTTAKTIAKTSTTAKTTETKTGVVSSNGNLNVRKTASTKSSVVQKLKKGSSVTILESKSGWYKVKSSNGTIGWVSSQYVKVSATKKTSTSSSKANTSNSKVSTSNKTTNSSVATTSKNNANSNSSKVSTSTSNKSTTSKVTTTSKNNTTTSTNNSSSKVTVSTSNTNSSKVSVSTSNKNTNSSASTNSSNSNTNSSKVVVSTSNKNNTTSNSNTSVQNSTSNTINSTSSNNSEKDTLINKLITTEGNVSSSEKTKLKENLNKLPLNLLKSVNDNGLKVLLTTKDVKSYYAYSFSGTMTGLFDPMAGKIYISSNVNHINKSTVHEFGHALDLLIGKTNYASLSNEWNNIYKAELNTASGSYYKANAQEYFADAFNRYIDNASKLKAEAPQTYAYINSAIKNL